MLLFEVIKLRYSNIYEIIHKCEIDKVTIVRYEDKLLGIKLQLQDIVTIAFFINYEAKTGIRNRLF